MMKKISLFLLLVLLLTACASKRANESKDLSIEEVQAMAQQTLTAEAGGSSASTGQLLIRPVTATPTVQSDTDAATISRPVYNTATPTAVSYQRPTVDTSGAGTIQQVSTVCERIRFLDDVTIPDNTVMAPGQPFRKTWRIQNAGSCAWSGGYQLVFVSGDKMGANVATNLPSVVAPGQTVEVSVDLTAPNAYGTYQSNWKMRSPNGNLFGTSNASNDAIWAKIVVGNSSNYATVAPGVTPVNTGCTLISVVPSYRQSLKTGEETDIFFRVRNNSNTVWSTENMDVAFIGGTNMLKRPDQTRKDLPNDIAPGNELYYGIDAVMPDTPGVYTMTMGVVRGYEVLCSMDVTVSVNY